jgi:protease-4
MSSGGLYGDVSKYKASSRKHPFLRGCLMVGLVLGVFLVLLAVLSQVDEGALDRGDKVAVLPITGLIADSESVIEQLKKYAKDENIKAIVIRINSPGGGVGPSQEIYEEVRKLRTRKDKKVVVTSMGALAASGGYYIACASQKIYANPGTITGSIGVIMPFVNLEDLAKKIGVRGMEVKSGRFKDTGSSMRPMTPEEKALLQAVVDNTHRQFVAAVAEGRRQPFNRVMQIADGRIMSGEQAKALGLVDAIGNLEDAVAEAGRLAGIKGEPKVVTPAKKKLSFTDLLKQEVRTLIDEKMSADPVRIEYIAK